MPMPIDFRKLGPNIPTIGDPAKVEGMTVIVVVTCMQCQARNQLGLLNSQPAICPTCGARVSIKSISWDVANNGIPKIHLDATRSIVDPGIGS